MYWYLLLELVSYSTVSHGLHCKDVDNKIVDWWYIYKPPRDTGFESMPGMQFFYITSKDTVRWQHSSALITDKDSMLDYTLAPLFSRFNKNHVAHMVYQEREASFYLAGASAVGILMGDEHGALWLTHTVPGLINLNESEFRFPVEETDEGHLITCLSIDINSMNGIGKALSQLAVDFVDVHLPISLKNILSDWIDLNIPIHKTMNVQKIRFKSRYRSLRIEVLVKPAGNHFCLYSAFAKHHNIVLDAYNHAHKSFCSPSYSVRNIDSISLKTSEPYESLLTWYITNTTDKMGFAVSTAAPWQILGKDPGQYWTCFGSEEHQRALFKSGLIVCVENYDVWWTFDNFKLKEPECLLGFIEVFDWMFFLINFKRNSFLTDFSKKRGFSTRSLFFCLVALYSRVL